ncbi:MAG: hypothetical protein A2X59_04400 [Nitrospirae bacterium GWC2_42_7]|nr:MAG: hypothetical protein A2X59_04400 [Nitrospirae bacterium GWC2_42_7]
MPECIKKITAEALNRGLTIGDIEKIANDIKARAMDPRKLLRIYGEELRTKDFATYKEAKKTQEETSRTRKAADPAKIVQYGDALAAELTAYEERLKAMSMDERISEAARATFEETIRKKELALHKEYLKADAQIKLTEQAVKIADRAGSEVMGLREILVGNKGGAGEHISVEAIKEGILTIDTAYFHKVFDQYITKLGNFKITDEQQKHLAMEMDKPGSSGSDAAKFFVENLSKWAERSRLRKNALGADIGKLHDWGIFHIWSAENTTIAGLSIKEKAMLVAPDKLISQDRKNALYAKAKNTWITEALQRADPARYEIPEGKSFADVLSEIFESIRTGGLNKGPAVGSGSTLRSMEAHRELHFKSALDWYEFNKKFGATDIIGIVTQAVRSNARETALMEVFSWDYNNVFKATLAQAASNDAIQPGWKSQKYVSFTKYIWAELTNEANSPEGASGAIIARWFQGLRSWTVATKGGHILLSQPNDIGIYKTIAQTDGLGVGDALRFFAKALQPLNKETIDAARQAGIASQAVLNDVGVRYGESIRGSEISNRVANAVLKASGVEYWTNAGKHGFQMAIGFDLAKAAELPYKDLSKPVIGMLKRYGIGEAEWKIIQQAEAVEIGRDKILTPIAIHIMQESPAIEAIADPAARQKAMDDIRMTSIKVAGMMTQEANIGIVSPGARELAAMHQGTKPGTFPGEMLRTVMLFKAFSASMFTKVLPRVMHSDDVGLSRLKIGAQFAVAMMVLGGISYQLKSIVLGKNPMEMFDEDGIPHAKFWMAAAAQSGGLGIFGDFLFSDFSRFGADVGSTFAGPVISGPATDLVKFTLGNARKEFMGKDVEWTADAIEKSKRNLFGFLNVWYMTAAINHMLYYQIQDAKNPGYLRRMKSRVERETGQDWWWNPEERLPENAPDLGAAFGARQ